MNNGLIPLSKGVKGSLWLLFAACAVIIFACEKQEKGKIYETPQGAWTAEMTSTQSVYTKYLVEIDKVKSSDDLYIISNFNNQGISEFLYANLRGDSLFIENQSISGIFINGKGRFNEEFNRLSLTYSADDGSVEIVYYGIYTR